MNLTPEQQVALELGVDRIVVAGAGSGKTHVLSVRYARLVAERVQLALASGAAPPEPDVVLVLTFTEKAAAEMAERCRARLVSLPAEGALRRGLDRIVDRFDGARIETFHAFAAALLREFPEACGVRPGVGVLDASRADRFRDEAMQQALEAAPEDVVRCLVPALGGRNAVAQALRTALDDRGRVEPALGAGVAPMDADEFAAVQAWLGALSARLSAAAVVLASAPDASPAARLAAAVRRLDVNGDPIDVVGAATEILRALTDGQRPTDLRHAAFLGRRDSWADKGAHDRARVAMTAMSASFADAPRRLAEVRRLPGPADRALPGTLWAFRRLAEDALARLRARFLLENAVDFAELQLLARRTVVGNPTVRDALVRRHAHVLVDEFQDTDEAQWELVRAIAPEPGQLFLVGDPKQAIYGFRGGDVTVFAEATRARAVASVPLSTNFRARPELIAVINHWFARILGPPAPGRPAWEASFEGLRVGREEPGGTVLVARCEGEGSDGVLAEAAAVSDLVGLYLDRHGPYASFAYGDRARHPAPPIAVLFRSRTHVAEFERALAARGVPCVVASGQGFYQRPEIVDLVNTVFAVATGDATALVGALRSPLFAVPDAELYAHAPFPPLDVLAGRVSGEGPLAASIACLVALRVARHELPLAGLVRSILAATRAVQAWAEGDPDGGAERNVARFVALASAAEGVSTLEVFASDAMRAVDAGSREAEVTVEPGVSRVVLMTVHASKGLEFPVVVVPRLGSRVRRVEEPLVVARPGGPGTPWRVATTVLDPAAPLRTRTAPGAFIRLSSQLESEEDAESRRLLYVALTRARDHLALVASPASADPGSWWSLLVEDRAFDVFPGVSAFVAGAAPQAAPEPPTSAPEVASGPAPVVEVLEPEVDAGMLDAHARCPAWGLLLALQGASPPDVRVRRDGVTLLGRLDVAGARGRAAVAWALGEGERPDEIALAAATLRSTWPDVLTRALADPRPCALCPFRGRPCPGAGA